MSPTSKLSHTPPSSESDSKRSKTDSTRAVTDSDRPKPEWISRINNVLNHEKNKDELDSKNIVLATVKDGQPFARYQ